MLQIKNSEDVTDKKSCRCYRQKIVEMLQIKSRVDVTDKKSCRCYR